MADAHLHLDVRLTPRASRDAIEGERVLADGCHVLSVRVRALPEDGAANDALMRLLAKACGIARSRVMLVSGAASRRKTLRIDGDPATLATALGLERRNGG